MFLGATVLGHRELPVAAISVAGPEERIRPRAAECVAQVGWTASGISLWLGCPLTAYTPLDHRSTPSRITMKGKS